jgi:phage major head subunit gpT-like protein
MATASNKVVQKRARSLRRSANALFQDAVEIQDEGPAFGTLTTTLRTDSRTEEFEWLTDFAQVTKFDGERESADFRAYGFEMTPEHYEVTLEIDANDLADERLNMYTRRIQSRVNAFQQHRRRLLMERVTNAFSETCYDGQPMISDAHPYYERQGDSNDAWVEEGVQSNIIEAGGVTNPQLNNTYDAAKALAEDTLTDIRTLRGDNGTRLSLNPDTVIVPEAQRVTAEELFEADQLLDETAGELRSNPLPDMTVIADDELDAQGFTEGFFLVDSNNPVLMPLIYLIRQGVETDSLLAGSEHAMKHNEFVYSADARYTIGFGHWQAMFGSDGSGSQL